MNKTTLLASVLISVVLSLGVYSVFFNQAAPSEKPVRETAFDRVVRTGELRCGYIILPPEFTKDINTGEFSGISHDITNAVARRLGLKVKWIEEVSFATMTAALESGRFDAICFSLYRYSPYALAVDYTVPLFATPTYAFVRADDDRFDGNVLAKANNAETTIVTIDGEASQHIAAEDFPKASVYSLPNLTNLTEMMVAVETKKADLALTNAAVAMPYLRANSGKLKIANPDNPLRLYSHGLVVKKGETRLRDSLNVAITEMIEHGEMDKILDRGHKTPGMIYRVQLPYRTESFRLDAIAAE